MTARTTEKAMELLLSVLMFVFFIILAPLWTAYYGGVLLKDYFAIAKA